MPGVYNSIGTSDWVSARVVGGGGMGTMPYRGIDIMGWTKDTLDNNVSSTQSDDLIESLASYFNLTHIGVSIPMNTNAEALADRGYEFDSEPATYAAQFNDKIHSEGLGVLWRGTDCTFEAGGLYNMTYSPSKRNGNRYTYKAEDITDRFGSDTLSNYDSVGNWSISGGTLNGPSPDGWRNVCLFVQDFPEYRDDRPCPLNDVTMTAKVQKIGHQQIIVRGSTDSNYPGYGLQMRDTNLLRLERPGLETLAEVGFTWSENDWYYLKLDAQGTTIRGKAWAVGDSEPGTWNISVTDSTYSSGFCGFSGETSSGKFDDMVITPIKDTDTWIARACDWIEDNISLFADGDILAPYPEADAHQALDEQGIYNSFWIELAHCLEWVCANNDLVCYTGLVAQNYTGVVQGGRSGEMFSVPNVITVDHYGASLGLNERFSSGDAARQVNVGGTDTYSVPTSISESSTDRCSFIPEKIALNMDIDIYIVDKGTGDWTMTIHDQYNNPVQLPDHTDFLSKTNNYQVTVGNGSLVDNDWNRFRLYWDNPITDQTYHFHLTSTVADGTVRVLSGNSGNLEYCGHEQFKTNATPEAMEIDIRKIYHKHSQIPVFVQEWGDYWSLDDTRSTPIRTESEHVVYLQSMYDAYARLADDEILVGFNYWRATGGLEEIMYDADSGSGYDYKPLYSGEVLSTYFSPPLWFDNVQVSESVTVATSLSNTRLVNVSDTLTVEDSLTVNPPDYLVIGSGDILDQQQDLGNTSAGFGQWSSVRYRGQGFQTDGENLTAISFQLTSVGTYGIKVYIDSADGDSIPDHNPGSELYSWTIENGDIGVDALTKYNLPTPLQVTPSSQYCFYLAPWNTSTNTYTDDYRDLVWQNQDVYSGGVAVVNTNGVWTVSDSGSLEMKFEIYTSGALVENIGISENITVETAYPESGPTLEIDISSKGVVIVG